MSKRFSIQKSLNETGNQGKGRIFDIKRYAVHDGPGIRTTVFFKGCPLGCSWCQNPEGMEKEPQIMYRAERCGKTCWACIPVCPLQAISQEGKKIKIDWSRCDLCGKCVDVCVYEALEIIGKGTTVEEVIKEIEKDKVFYDQSGGGATISGGEPFMQPEFLEALLDALNERKIHTAVDTSGFVSPEILEKLYTKIDLFLYDIKVMDKKKHKQYTGVDNSQILDNLKTLSKKERPVVVRMPIISGVNDNEKNIVDLAQFLWSLNLNQIDLLPYHRGWVEKYKRLKKKTPQGDFHPPSEKKSEEIKKTLEDHGFSVKIGG
ncbi:glycyl-radical enzyme activating protein [bacterium]|nr:glycyl-radical enzyme activating protein [bacterium]